jgi:hypothetical protein
MAAQMGLERDPRALHRRAHGAIATGLEKSGEALFMNFQCKYCNIIWTVELFDEIREIQDTQCFVTMNGVNHDLKAVFE